MATRGTIAAVLILLAACGPTEEERRALEEASRIEAAADTVAQAEGLYDAAAFDSIAWAHPDSAIARGGIVFRYSCAKCHGDAGDGNGEFVMRGDTLHPPSFLTGDWRFRDDHEGLRHQIFVGTVNNMPHWGLEGLKPRDIDAVATYIREGLRG